MASGLAGRTRNVDGFCIGSTWPSWYTGVTPARHGLHYLVQLKPGTYQLYRPADEGLVKRDAFWSHMSRAGRRVAVLDVPVSAVDRSLNGVQTVEWGGHDAVFGLQSHPADLAERIVSTFGTHPAATPCDEIRRTAERVPGLRDASRGRRAFEDGVDAASCLARVAGISLSRYSRRHTASATSVGTCTIRPTRHTTHRWPRRLAIHCARCIRRSTLVLAGCSRRQETRAFSWCRCTGCRTHSGRNSSSAICSSGSASRSRCRRAPARPALSRE